jgi:hypothetical protein
MKQKPSSRRRRNSAKSVLRLPDLEHAKTAVLNILNSTDAKLGYRHAIDEFVDWKEGKRAPELRCGLAALRAISSKRGIGYREEKGTSQTQRPVSQQ